MKNLLHKLSQLRYALILIAMGAFTLPASDLKVFEYEGLSYYLTGAPIEIATWRNGALGVYTSIHDDWGSNSISQVYTVLDTLMRNRGLVSSSAAISAMCDDYYVSLGKEFIRNGHEIHSHSVTHTQGMSRHEIFESKRQLEELFGVPMEFYVFPFDQWNDEAIQHLKDAGYIGSRSGNRYPLIDAANQAGTIPNLTNPADFDDPFALQFDVYPRNNSGYKNVPDNGDPTAWLKRYVQDAVDHKSWAIHEFHDISTSNSLSIPLEHYQSLMDSVAAFRHRNELWVSGPTDVIRYRFSREHSGDPKLSQTEYGYSLTFGEAKNLAELKKHLTSVTVFFRAPAMSGHITASQDGDIIPSKRVEQGYFAVDANPLGGPVTISPAPKPWYPHPFLDPVDTVPSKYDAWLSFGIYQGRDTVYHNGAEYRPLYWTQGDEPGVVGPWVKLRAVPEKAIYARASKGGTISYSGKTIVAPGSTKSYRVTPDSGYEVDNLIINGIDMGPLTEWTFENISKHHTIEAVLSPIVESSAPRWQISATAKEGGKISPSGISSVIEGANALFTISPDSGFICDSVVVNGANKGVLSTYTFTNVKSDQSITAWFSAIPSFTVSAEASKGGKISPAGEISLQEGSSANFTISTDEGYRYDSLTVNGLSQGTPETWAISDISKNMEIKAWFSALPTFTVTAFAGSGGSIYPSGEVVAAEGSDLNFAITANSGFAISQIILDGKSLDIAGTVTLSNISKSSSLEVTFEEIPVVTYEITAEAGANGTISPSGKVVVEAGESITFTIAADSSYEVEDVIVNNISKGPLKAITLDNIGVNTLVKATFREIVKENYTITATAGANGTISPEGVFTLVEGESAKFYITADIGYLIDDLLVNGVSVGSVSQYTVSEISENITLNASFKAESQAGCDVEAYIHGTIYRTNDHVSEAGHIWRAKWWTQNERPGTTGQWGVWENVGVCEAKVSAFNSIESVVVSPTVAKSSDSYISVILPSSVANYSINILNATGASIFSENGSSTETRWNLTNRSGERVSGQFQIVVQMVMKDGSQDSWIGQIGVQR